MAISVKACLRVFYIDDASLFVTKGLLDVIEVQWLWHLILWKHDELYHKPCMQALGL